MEQGSTERSSARFTSAHRPAPEDPTWDFVDQIVTDMRRVTPAVDLSSLHVVSRMLQVVRVFDRCREEALKGHGLESWSFDMLAAIRRSPAEQIRPGDLMQFTFVTSGTMSTRLDSLERRGLIIRRRDTSDRRGVFVVITKTGRDRIDEAFDDVITCQRELIAGLDPAENLELERLLRRIIQHDHVHADD